MIEIHCNASPFIFKPILKLLNHLRFEPTTSRGKMILVLLDPFNEKNSLFKADSHLTDAQTKEEQIRYLGNVELNSKMIDLARILATTLKNETIIFRMSPHFEMHKLFNTFLKHLKLQTGNEILLSIETDEGKPCHINDISSKIDSLYYSSDTKKTENAQAIFDAARICINTGDYYSGINLLLSIHNLQYDDSLFRTEILSLLAICHSSIDELKVSVFYWNEVYKQKNYNPQSRSSYALGLMYLRHLPKQFQDIDLAEKFLNDWYEKLLNDKTQDRIRIQFDQVFNRNGYALAAFKRGKLEEAQTLVSNGIATLDEIDSSLSIFHQSVLYYNLAQCYKAKNEIQNVEKTLEKLIEIDPKFNLYHQYLIEFYIENNMINQAAAAVEDSFKVDQNHLHFHYLKGKILLLQGDENNALKAFEAAHQLNPLDTGTLGYLSSLYNSQENYEAVLNCLKTFHFKFSNEHNGEIIINNLVIALLNDSERSDEVNALIEESIGLKPESEFFQEIAELIKEEYAD